MINIEETAVGTFEVKSGNVCITDPCYDRGTWCAAWDLPAKNGMWLASYQVGNDDEGGWVGVLCV